MKNSLFLTIFLIGGFINCSMTRQKNSEAVKQLMIGNWHLLNSFQPQTNKYSYPESDTFDVITFFKDFSYKSKTHVFKTSGTWELNQDNTRFKLIPKDSNTPFVNRKETFDWIILKLDNDTLRYQIDRKGIHDKLIKTYIKTIK